VGIFPNEAAVLHDMHDEWQVSDRRYLSEGSMAQLNPNADTGPIAAIPAAE
jgi:putative transposase